MDCTEAVSEYITRPYVSKRSHSRVFVTTPAFFLAEQRTCVKPSPLRRDANLLTIVILDKDHALLAHVYRLANELYQSHLQLF
jgi:hypothetical protein